MKGLLARIASMLAVCLTLMPIPAYGETAAERFHGYGPHMMGHGGWMFLGPVMMIAFIAIAVAAVVLLVRRVDDRSRGARASSESNATDILKERFARGDIDKEEYEERRRILSD